MPRKRRQAGKGTRTRGKGARQSSKGQPAQRGGQTTKPMREPVSYVKYHSGDGARTTCGFTVHCVGEGGLLTAALGIGPEVKESFTENFRTSIMKRFVDMGRARITGLEEGKISDSSYWSGSGIMFTVKTDPALPLGPTERVHTSYPGARLSFGMFQERLFHKISKCVKPAGGPSNLVTPEGFSIDTINWLAPDEKTPERGALPHTNTLTIPPIGETPTLAIIYKSSKYPAPFRTKSKSILVGESGAWFVNYHSGK